MGYDYLVLKVKPELLQNELSIYGKKGWKLFHVQPLNDITTYSINGQPKIELSYQLIFEIENSAS